MRHLGIEPGPSYLMKSWTVIATRPISQPFLLSNPLDNTNFLQGPTNLFTVKKTWHCLEAFYYSFFDTMLSRGGFREKKCS